MKQFNLQSRMGMTNTPPYLRVNGSSKFLKSLALLFVLMLGVGNVWGAGISLSDLSFGNPIVDENFESLTTCDNTAKVAVSKTDQTAYGAFNCIYNNSTSNHYGIASNSTFGSKILSLTAGSGSPLIAHVTNKSFGTVGSFRVKTDNASKCYIGLYAETSGTAYAGTNSSVYISNTTGALSINSGGSWVSIGSYSTSIIDICVIYNNTTSPTTYGNNISLEAKKAHVFVNGNCVMNGDNPKTFTIPGKNLVSFRVLPQPTSGNKCYCDDIQIYNALPTSASTKTAVSMEVTTQPTKTTYTQGEDLDLSGMVVKCTYDDASTDDAYTKYTADPIAGTALNTIGQQTVTLTSTEKNTVTTSFKVTVNAPKTLSSISVTTQPTKKSYTTCETLDLTGCVVKAKYSDNSEEDVTSSCTFNPANGSALTTSVTTVAVSYNSKETSIDNISVTQGARDTFQDDIHGNDPKYGDCNGYTIPSLEDATKGSGCDGEHYKFIGWSTSPITSGATTEPAGLLKAGATHDATNTTYYAVWAKEVTE